MTITVNSGTVTISGDGTATWSGATPSAIGGQPVWTPPRSPDAPAEGSETPQVNVARFGDGYRQRAAKGLNHIDMTLTVTFSNLYAVDKDAILQFVRARRGVEPFWWQQPDELMRRWVATRWQLTQQGWDRWAVSVQMERDWSPVASA